MKNYELWVLGYLFNSLWQIPLLCAAGCMVARALRSVGAAAEHRVWVGTSLLQAVLPACSIAFRTARWDWLRVFDFRHWQSGAEGHVSVMLGAGSAATGAFLPPMLLGAVAATYAAVTAYLGARYVWRCAALFALRRGANPVILTGGAALCWAKYLRSFGVGHASLAASSRVFGPATMGVRGKLLLLPAGMQEKLTMPELKAVFAHECAHMRRNDFAKNLAYELLALPVLYHPLAWFTRARLLESREMVCDEITAQAIGHSKYARSLLRLASVFVTEMPARVPHAIGIFDAHMLERRLMRITEIKPELGRVQRLAIIAACITLGFATCGSALALGMQMAAPISSDSASAKTALPPEVMAGQIVSKVQPKYPEAAKKSKVQGTVVLDAVIGKDGAVENLRIVSGPEELRPSSLEAVRHWTYRPFLLNGTPVEVTTTINVTYSLAP